MKIFNFFNKRLPLVFVTLGLIVGILSVMYIPFLLLGSYLFVFTAIIIDSKEKHPYVISRARRNMPEIWDDELVYTYSITYLKFCFWWRMYLFKSNIIYSFTPFHMMPEENRQKCVNEYFAKQN